MLGKNLVLLRLIILYKGYSKVYIFCIIIDMLCYGSNMNQKSFVCV